MLGLEFTLPTKVDGGENAVYGALRTQPWIGGPRASERGTWDWPLLYQVGEWRVGWSVLEVGYGLAMRGVLFSWCCGGLRGRAPWIPRGVEVGLEWLQVCREGTGKTLK